MNDNIKGILIVDKPSNYTSRDIVNIVGKKLNTKKIGHTGTLDPLATGVLVLCIGKYSKVSELITNYDKEYIATIIIGVDTDTLDINSEVKNTKDTSNISDEEIYEMLKHFNKTYMQEVPKYSAVKIKGKKLYEYARNNIEVELPKREVSVSDIELVSDIMRVNNQITFSFKCSVTKGTYIRSLIRDMGEYLDNYAIMSELRRTRQGNFNIEDSFTLEDIENNRYKLLDITDVLGIEECVVKEDILFKIKNGSIIDKTFTSEMCLMLDEDKQVIAIYQTYDKDNTKARPYKMF